MLRWHSCADKEVRDKAVKALERYLRTAHDISESEVRKIWKALFYCFWHSDKPKVQADLAERLACLVHAMPVEKAWLFARVFWATMTREWTTIDRLRLDKFYMLMRKSLAQQLRRAGRARWGDEEVEPLAEMLGGTGGPIEPKAPPGVKYFLCDNFLPSLKDALLDSAGGGGGGSSKRKASKVALLLSEDAFLVLLDPFLRLLGFAEDDGVLRRCVDGVVQPLLAGDDDEEPDDDEEEADEADDDDKEPPPPPEAALPRPLGALSERLFALASERDTRDRNRKLMYALQQRVESLAEAAAAEAAAEAAAVEAAKPKKKRSRAAEASAAPAARAAEEPAAADPAKVSALRNLLSKRSSEAPAGKAGKPAKVSKARKTGGHDEAETMPPAKKAAAGAKKRRET